MSTTTDDIQIRRLDVPSTPDDATFRAHHALSAAHSDARYGDGIMHRSPAEQLALWHSTSAERVDIHGAWRGDRLLGHAGHALPLQESTDVLDFGTCAALDATHAEQAEIHELLVEHAMQTAHAEGRTTVMGGGPGGAHGAVTASTGHGGADPDDLETAPLVRRGFTLEQVYRLSIADVDRLDDLDERLAAARARATDYDVVAWSGWTPAAHRADMRTLHERMSTDAPVGGLSLEPETWSDARLREFEEQKAAGGRTLRTVAAQDAHGRLVGFSRLFVGEGSVARQHDTLVLTEHRGHGLGLLLKLANLVELRDHHPDHRRISTMNAEENRPMLRVNEAVGFETAAFEAVWQLQEHA